MERPRPGRAQLGLAILLANTLKWHKVKTGHLTPMKIEPPKRQTVPTQAAG